MSKRRRKSKIDYSSVLNDWRTISQGISSRPSTHHQLSSDPIILDPRAIISLGEDQQQNVALSYLSPFAILEGVRSELIRRVRESGPGRCQ
jgi:hypothetical protein